MLSTRSLSLLTSVALASLAVVLAGLSGNSGVSPGGDEASAAVPALIVDQCVEVSAKDTFEVDIFVTDVSQLLAWDIYYAFDRNVVEVTGRNVHRMLEAAPSSNVFDFSDPVPNSTGIYRLAAADTGGVDAAENGSGLLATLTLRAKREGVSWSALHKSDVNGDGSIDIGPTLTAIGGAQISDNDGDGVFDGALRGGQVAVDTDCREAAPTPTIAPGTIVISPSGVAPVVSEDDPDDPGTDDDDETGSEPAAEAGSDVSPTPTQPRETEFVSVLNEGDSPRPSGGDSNSTLATWLVGALAGSAALGVALTYVIYRTRRPI
jgi:hypothetical protein